SVTPPTSLSIGIHPCIRRCPSCFLPTLAVHPFSAISELFSVSSAAVDIPTPRESSPIKRRNTSPPAGHFRSTGDPEVRSCAYRRPLPRAPVRHPCLEPQP